MRPASQTRGILGKVMAHRRLHMAKAIAAKFLSAEPARDDDDVIDQVFAFEHPQDDHARARLSVIRFDRRNRAIDGKQPLRS